MEVSRFCVGKEGIGPPDSVQHLVGDAQFILAGVRKIQSWIMPVLTEVEVKRKILQRTAFTVSSA
jgi:hypothetical protein